MARRQNKKSKRRRKAILLLQKAYQHVATTGLPCGVVLISCSGVGPFYAVPYEVLLVLLCSSDGSRFERRPTALRMLPDLRRCRCCCYCAAENRFEKMLLASFHKCCKIRC